MNFELKNCIQIEFTEINITCYVETFFNGFQTLCVISVMRFFSRFNEALFLNDEKKSKRMSELLKQ